MAQAKDNSVFAINIQAAFVGALTLTALAISMNDVHLWTTTTVVIAGIIGWMVRSLLRLRDDQQSRTRWRTQADQKLAEMESWMTKHQEESADRHEQMMRELTQLDGRQKMLETQHGDEDDKD